MGRTVKEKHVFDSRMANELALEVVSEETGVEKEELKKTLQNLQSLLPELSSSSLSSNADAYRASLDIKLVARNAIQIKSVFRE
jgi:Trm5-related predicted tRNA methylase